MKFWNVFGASLLAIIVASMLSVAAFVMFCIVLLFSFDFETEVVPKQSVLYINLSENIIDSPTTSTIGVIDPMTFEFTEPITIFEVLTAIENAAKDGRIKGICIYCDGTGVISPTNIEELRSALERFKKSGKFVIAYDDMYTQSEYYLATAADQIILHPEGSLQWNGLGMTLTFFKGLMDKLDVKAEIFRPTECKYKSAVEPYFLTQMSDANRQQMQEMVDNMWGVLTDAVSASRGIGKAELNRLADELAVMLPEEAVANKLIDGVKYADQMEELFEAEYGIEDVEYVTLGEYVTGLKPDVSKITAPKVAILYAQGQIFDGEGSDDNIYGYTLARQVRELADDDDIKAVVMRVNSPGGSALASDIVWREVELLKAKKPVIVSMGAYAASGGYYISAPADAIVADKLTLTGSIGVFGMLPSYGEAVKNKIGITFDGVSTNKYSTIGSGVTPLNDTEYRAMMRGVDRVYERFTSLVAQGRNLTIEKVLEIAEGRVWNGVQAQQIGLVDTNGGLNAALSIAVDKAELGDNFQIVEHSEPLEGFMALLQGMNVKVRQAITSRSELGELYLEYKQVESLLGKKGVYALCPFVINFE